MTKTMKHLGTALLGALLTVAVLSAWPNAAKAESLLDMQIREASKLQSAERVRHNDSNAIRLFYVGSATEAVVTITTAGITSYAPAGTSDGVDFSSSATGTLLFADALYDTVGELCDYIDSRDDYGCERLGAKRSDHPRRLRDQTAASGSQDLKSSTGSYIKFSDESEATTPTLNGQVYDIRLGIQPKSGKRVILKTCTINGNVIDTARIYGKLAKYEGIANPVRDDSTEVWRVITADDTDLQLPLDISEDGWLEFGKNEHVVVSVGEGEITGVQAAANFIECLWTER